MFPKTGFGGNVNAMECDKHSATNGVKKKINLYKLCWKPFHYLNLCFSLIGYHKIEL